MLTYQKIVFPEKERAEVRNDTIDETRIPEGHYLLKTLYSLVSAGTETACYRGVEAWFPLPGTPGYACVGEVIAKADDVDCVSVGDTVFCRGKHAGLQLMPNDSLPVKVPAGVDIRYVPFTRMAAISVSSLRVSDIELGDDVLVIGLGLIGNFASQLATLQDGNVLAMDLSEMRLAAAAECDVAHTLRTVPNQDMTPQIKEVFNGRMPTTVIDATGVPRVAEQGMNYVQKGGQMILLGSPRGEYVGNVTNILQHVHQFRYQIDLLGAHEMVAPRAITPYVKHSAQRNERICLDLIAQNRLKIGPLLTRVLKPEQAEEVYRGVLRGDETYFGVIYDWT
ncbi:MAG: zinc-binding alcohol dehydrogenase [Clostridiales bacterium]|nr:zinc-binding alcohol dehydrogenase [Clostridiales bacterium]